MDRPSESAPASCEPASKRSDDSGLDRIVDRGDAVIIAFVTRWCRACKIQTRCLAELGLRAGYGHGADLCCVDVAADPLAAQRWRVAAVPTLVVCLHGREVARQVGLRSLAECRCFLARAFACALPARNASVCGSSRITSR